VETLQPTVDADAIAAGGGPHLVWSIFAHQGRRPRTGASGGRPQARRRLCRPLDLPRATFGRRPPSHQSPGPGPDRYRGLACSTCGTSVRRRFQLTCQGSSEQDRQLDGDKP
jgi:hypothetical protein